MLSCVTRKIMKVCQARLHAMKREGKRIKPTEQEDEYMLRILYKCTRDPLKRAQVPMYV